MFHLRRDAMKYYVWWVVVLGTVTGVFAGAASSDGEPTRKIEVKDHGAIWTQFYPAKHLEKGQKAPLVFFCGGSEGGMWPGDSQMVKDLREHGSNVVTVGYFHMEGLPDTLTLVDLEPFGKAIEIYKQHPGVDSERIGIIGGSKGGELALILGSLYPDLHMIVAFVPSSVAFQGTKMSLSHYSSWRYRGKPWPFVPYPSFSWAMIKGVFSGENYRDMHILALTDTEAVKAATTKVEKINASVLFFSAKHDQWWPSTEMSDTMMARLKRHNFPHPYKHIAWDSDHAVLADPKAWAAMLDFVIKDFKLTP
jgi:dienelactone hydrolase